jgi:hypothetical protein
VLPSSQRPSHRARTARVSRRPPSFAVTLVALAIVFALAWVFFLRSGETVSAPLVTSMQGTYTWTQGPEGDLATQEGTFSTVAAGDAGGRAEEYREPGREDGPVRVLSSAFDADTRTATTTRVAAGRPVLRTVGSWPPVWQVATRSPLDYQGLAAIVRTAVEDGDQSVGIKPVKDGDRAVWRASLRLDGEQVDVVVDQETGILTWYSSADETFTADVDWDSPPPAGTTYSVDVPAGTEVETVRSRAQYAASPAEAGREAGYDPLVSSLAPDGYGLKAVATIDDFPRPFGWLTTETVNVRHPPGMRWPLVVQLYTRGLAWFTMEQAHPEWVRSWRPTIRELSEAATDNPSYRETTLQYGALKGETALTWYQESGPSLFVAAERRAVFVTGALTRQELVAFAEGLTPVPAAE